MKNVLFLSIIGALAGAFSWVLCPLVSNSFEPFDSGVGLFLGQALLSLTAICIGYTHRFIGLTWLLLGMHVGQNLYAYLFGGGEQRTWIVLGVLTTISLLVMPFLLGSVAVAVASRFKRSC